MSRKLSAVRSVNGVQLVNCVQSINPVQAEKISMHSQRAQGFTLLEVMVALAIFAVAAIALTKAGMSYTQSVMSLRERTLAHFVLMNEAAQLSIQQAWPEGTGQRQLSAFGSEWQISQQVSATPSADTRRVELTATVLGDQQTNSSPAAPSTNGGTATEPISSRLVIFVQKPVASGSN